MAKEATLQNAFTMHLSQTGSKRTLGIANGILHFYIDGLGMEFWSARLFKKIR